MLLDSAKKAFVIDSKSSYHFATEWFQTVQGRAILYSMSDWFKSTDS